MQKILITLLSFSIICTPGFAKNLPETAKQEIEQLLNKLESSNCQFNRNGSWYTSKEAKTHLQKKLEYLVDKGEITSSDQFIELAATKSSMSGKHYYVQCAGAPQTESNIWLSSQLKQIRQLAK
jgi:hypothetical protein